MLITTCSSHDGFVIFEVGFSVLYSEEKNIIMDQRFAECETFIIRRNDKQWFPGKLDFTTASGKSKFMTVKRHVIKI